MKRFRPNNLIAVDSKVIKIDIVKNDFITWIAHKDKDVTIWNPYIPISDSRIEPLKLNFKWFNDFGFTPVKSRVWYDLILKEKRFAISINENSGKVALNLGGSWHTLPFKEIKFVHELQNFLLELIDIELTI